MCGVVPWTCGMLWGSCAAGVGKVRSIVVYVLRLDCQAAWSWEFGAFAECVVVAERRVVIGGYWLQLLVWSFSQAGLFRSWGAGERRLCTGHCVICWLLLWNAPMVLWAFASAALKLLFTC